MTKVVELGDFEWEKHRPSWGEIPVARRDHFAFVWDKKMFIMGGETIGAPPDGAIANNSPFLDLTSWTWGRQKMTGSAPSTGFLGSNCIFSEEDKVVKVTLGPRWEAGSYMVIDIYTLDLTTWVWKQESPRGRWNINWKMEVTAYVPGSKKLVQFGRYPLSNFNDTQVSGVMHHSNMGWTTWYELGGTEKESHVLTAMMTSPDRLTVVWFNETAGTSTWTSYNASAVGTTSQISCGTLQRTGSESVAPIVVANYLLLFENQTLCADRVTSVRLDTLSASSASESKFIKSSTRAPQKPRVGTSVVHYDGYLIFFGGALSKELGAKLSNEVHVLSVAPHSQLESVLDSLAIADATLQSVMDEDGDKSSAPDVIELDSGSKSSKKKRPSKRVLFKDNNDSNSDDDGPKKTEKTSADAEPQPSSDAASSSAPPSDSASTSTADTATDSKPAEEPKKPEPPISPPADSEEKPRSLIDKISGMILGYTSKDTSPTKEEGNSTPSSSQSDKKPLSPEERVLQFLDANQSQTQKLLEFAVDNVACYPDMAFKVNGEIFWAHKAIVCARSSRWRQHLDPQGARATKYSSPSSARRSSSDFEDSELDVSNESAVPMAKESTRGGSPSPFMFGKLGSSAIDLMLDEEEDTRPKFEMIALPDRYAEIEGHPMLGGPPAAPRPSTSSTSTSTASSAASKTASALPVALASSSSNVSSSNDSIQSSASSSGIAPPAKSVPVYTLEDLDTAAFAKVLTYLYTGSISVTAADAELVGDVAHEFLLDDVSSICRERQAKSWSENPVKTSRLLRRLVGSPIGSDYFFVVRHKKLFAHRFIVFLFSPHFRELMLQRAEKSYVEVRAIEEKDIAIEVFIDFCRMMYCNFTSLPEHAEKKMDLTNLSKLATEWEEYRAIRLMRSAKPEAKSTLELYRIASSKPELMRDVRKTIIIHFSKFVQEKSTMKRLTKSEQLDWLHLGALGGASWLDKLWFAHTIDDPKLLQEAESNLGLLINVENVLPVLFCAHQVGVKPLRSLCMDFMTTHSTSIEDARRMQVDAPVALGKVGSLSASVNQELSNKLASATSGSKLPMQKVKSCGICSKTFSTFGKKNNCILCHKTACGDCTKKKVTIPPIFGLAKPRDICISCAQVVDLWSDPGNKR